MRPAAVEQYLKTISRLQKGEADGASLSAIAAATDMSQEQARKRIRSLVERDMVQIKEPGGVRLTAYGLRRLLTESIEDYIVTIYRLSRIQEKERITTSAIAQALDVSPPSVTSMIQKKLARLNLVDYQRHRGVILTPLGEEIALQILRHHRVVELYLSEILDLPWDQVHDEANRLEHAMSPALVERMAAALGDPLVDPHGDPIPRKDGTVVRAGLSPLYETPPGKMVIVRRIRDQSSEVLRYLGEIGLIPGTSVRVITRAPLNGPLTIRVGENQHVLGRELAHTILVAPPPAESPDEPEPPPPPR